MPRKTDFQLGMEAVLNNPNTSFLKQPKVFQELHASSQMSMSQLFREVGKTSRTQKKKEPTDDDRSKERLAKMEAESKE